MDKKIAILVPCYNEEQTISQIGSDLRKTNYPYLILNDGSTDMTTKLLKINNFPHFNSYPNKGKGYAIKLGAKKLIQDGFDYILVMDADGQNTIKDIKSFIAGLEKNPFAKIIIGNRFHVKQKIPLIRYLTNKIMSRIVSKLATQTIPDSQCGMRLVHKDVFKLKTSSNNFEYESEQLIIAGRKKYEIKSTPISCIYKKGRESKINPLPDTIKFVKMIKKFR